MSIASVFLLFPFHIIFRLIEFLYLEFFFEGGVVVFLVMWGQLFLPFFLVISIFVQIFLVVEKKQFNWLK